MIRPSTDADLEAITAIYGYHVLNGAGTFELEPPALEEMRGRRASVLSSGWLWLVTCDDRSGDVLGYASANTYRPRAAYRFCVEDSIYLLPRATGRGLGKALLRGKWLR